MKYLKLVVSLFVLSLWGCKTTPPIQNEIVSEPKNPEQQSTYKYDPAGPPPGHSNHGEAFNKGPRQTAYLMGTTSNVSFPITTDSTKAQAFFNQGIGQLHGFWYLEAERSFRQVLKLHPEHPMAYWGIAIANDKNGASSKSIIKKAVAWLSKVGNR